MKYYPVNLDIRGQRCLVVGGGQVGTRKVKTLLECQAEVTVVSPMVEETLQTLADTGKIKIEKREYQKTDLDGMFLVIGTTDDEALNRGIYKDAQKQNKLCNIADSPESCNFILPAIVHRGDLVISVSTSGASPAFAKKLRKDLQKQYGEEYKEFLQLMRAIRKKLLNEQHDPEAHKHHFEKLIDKGLLELVKHRETKKINALLREMFGEEYLLETLM
ncbi:MAG: bifunctional precorrin-2 dehydrogenase/sirohydrochlorin ferrochelatase [Deltaproteobacteria bacterium]|nr:bifunctional precorrin-2 dehydrogenase/sirohydrochlorin ferrochelatase [Deltaproteobacteria bacterium]